VTGSRVTFTSHSDFSNGVTLALGCIRNLATKETHKQGTMTESVKVDGETETAHVESSEAANAAVVSVKEAASNNDAMDEDEEDADDEDYNPDDDKEADKDDGEDEDNGNVGSAHNSVSYKSSGLMSHLSSLQVMQVDAAFEQLFGYQWGTRFDLPVDRPLTVTESMLREALGPTQAAAVLRIPATTGNNGSVHKKRQESKYTYNTQLNMQNRYTTRPYAAYSSIMQPTPCAVKYYAPTTIASATATATDTTTTTADSLAPSTAHQSTSKRTVAPSAAVSDLITALQGPQTTSTVAQTSADWDRFKDTSGLGSHLEDQAESSQSFLKRQDFLQRVDHRTFELEKRERDMERAKRGK
jgi:Bucentaur or craniofacial development